MKIRIWALLALLIIAAFVGAGGMLVSLAVNRYTSTDAFCTSCHTMVLQAADPYFQRAAHRSNSEGVVATCADCHIPTTNWFIETWVHVSSGVRDVFVTATHNFNDPRTWDALRARLEPETLANIRGWDSSPCRNCHQASAIKPKTEDGRQAHEALGAGGVTCVDCHINIVHPPATQQQGASLARSS